MGKTGKIILTVAVIFAAFLVATFMVGRTGQDGALQQAINKVIGIINNWVANFTNGEVDKLINSTM